MHHSAKQQRSSAATAFACASATGSIDSGVILRTFRAWVTGEHEGGYVRGVIDEEGQRTFISEDVSKTLQLRVDVPL